MKNKTINVLLVGQDLKEILLVKRSGKLGPLELNVEVCEWPADEEDINTFTALEPALHELTALQIPSHSWNAIRRPGHPDAPELYMSMVNMDDLAPAIAAHDGWQRAGLQATKRSALRGDAKASELAPLFQALDESRGANHVMLKSFLQHLSRDVQADQAHRVINKDCPIDGAPYCSECSKREAERLNESIPHKPYHVVEHDSRESLDQFLDCSDCGTLLTTQYSQHCIESETEKIIRHGISFRGKNAGRKAWRVLDLLRSPHHYFDPVKDELCVMLREGGVSLSADRLRQVTRDEEVAHSVRFRGLSSVRAAVINGGSPNTVDRETGMPAAYSACKRGDLELAKFLHDQGADFDRPVIPRRIYLQDGLRGEAGNTSLHQAIRDNDLLEFVLQHVKNVNAQNRDGQTALHLLCDEFVRPDDVQRAVKQLIGAGADLSLKNDFGHTPIDLAQQRDRKLAKLLRGLQAAQVAEEAIKVIDTNRLRPL